MSGGSISYVCVRMLMLSSALAVALTLVFDFVFSSESPVDTNRVVLVWILTLLIYLCLVDGVAASSRRKDSGEREAESRCIALEEERTRVRGSHMRILGTLIFTSDVLGKVLAQSEVPEDLRLFASNELQIARDAIRESEA